MRVAMNYIAALLLLTSMNVVEGQPALYVPGNSNIFFAGDSAGIFSNVINSGNFGVATGAVIDFKGQRWENGSSSVITSERWLQGTQGNSGGWIRFSADSRQFLSGGFIAAGSGGARFAKLELANVTGLSLYNSSTKIAQELKLTRGLFFLTGQNLVVGDGNPGKITGYDQARFIVTGNKAGVSFLIREQVSKFDGLVVFPVGVSDRHYTPAAIRSGMRDGDDFFVNVFDSVRSGGSIGEAIALNTVNKTWEIGTRNGNASTGAEVYLQHLVSDEGPAFKLFRKNAYMSQYTSGRWDMAGPQGPPDRGHLTTGSPTNDGGVNSRVLTFSAVRSLLLTKKASILSADEPGTKIRLAGDRRNPAEVDLYWADDPDAAYFSFIVMRKLANETEFKAVDTVLRLASSDSNALAFTYEITDPNGFEGNSYYKLLIAGPGGKLTESNTIAISGTPDEKQLLIWPNPSTGRFNVGITGMAAVRSVVIWDVLGRKIWDEPVRERSIIQLQLYKPGSYFVGFISPGGQVLSTKKLIIRPF